MTEAPHTKEQIRNICQTNRLLTVASSQCAPSLTTMYATVGFWAEHSASPRHRAPLRALDESESAAIATSMCSLPLRSQQPCTFPFTRTCACCRCCFLSTRLSTHRFLFSMSLSTSCRLIMHINYSKLSSPGDQVTYETHLMWQTSSDLMELNKVLVVLYLDLEQHQNICSVLYFSLALEAPEALLKTLTTSHWSTFLRSLVHFNQFHSL